MIIVSRGRLGWDSYEFVCIKDPSDQTNHAFHSTGVFSEWVGGLGVVVPRQENQKRILELYVANLSFWRNIFCCR